MNDDYGQSLNEMTSKGQPVVLQADDDGKPIAWSTPRDIGSYEYPSELTYIDMTVTNNDDNIGITFMYTIKDNGKYQIKESLPNPCTFNELNDKIKLMLTIIRNEVAIKTHNG